MWARLLGDLVNAVIPFIGGLYCCLLILGCRKVGKRPGQNPKLDDWHARFDKVLRLLGPVFMFFSIILFFIEVCRPR